MRVLRFALEDHFARYKASCTHNLTSSDVQAVTVEELLHSADEEVRELWWTATLAYGASRGHPLLRAEVASSHRTVEDPDAVHVFSGATEAIFALVNVLVGPGDHAVVLGPPTSC